MKNALLICLLLSFCKLAGMAQNYRPKYHYSPPKNWVNDPNGLVYLDGEYHLFTQYNPYGTTWGHMSWGHAVSTDLWHWKTLPIAMEEYWNADSTQTMLFSGCVVVDSLNSSGFFKKGFKKGLVAVFTGHVHKNGKEINQNQSLMYSADKGRTWQLYKENPVLDIGLTNFRDPNVIWYEPQQKWVMAVVVPLEYKVQFYESTNLKNWQLMSEFAKQGDVRAIWECPSLCKVPLQDGSGHKWLLTVSGSHRVAEGFVGVQYFIGDFDGQKFIPQQQQTSLYMDEGKDYYAPIPYYNVPKSQKYPLMIGWTNNWKYADKTPTQGYRGGFSLPRQLSIYEENGLYQLAQKALLPKDIATKRLQLTAGKNTLTRPLNFDSNSYVLHLTINTGSAKGFDLHLLKNDAEQTSLSYNVATKTLALDRRKSGRVAFHPAFESVESAQINQVGELLDLTIIVDNSIVEVFANGGRTVISSQVFPTKNKGSVSFKWW